MFQEENMDNTLTGFEGSATRLTGRQRCQYYQIILANAQPCPNKYVIKAEHIVPEGNLGT